MQYCNKQKIIKMEKEIQKKIIAKFKTIFIVGCIVFIFLYPVRFLAVVWAAYWYSFEEGKELIFLIDFLTTATFLGTILMGFVSRNIYDEKITFRIILQDAALLVLLVSVATYIATDSTVAFIPAIIGNICGLLVNYIHIRIYKTNLGIKNI